MTVAVVVIALLGLGVALGVVAGDDLALRAAARLDTDRDPATAWFARFLLLLAAAWILIGILAARTRLVGRPGAAAPRATWIAASRPWRARESTLGLLTLDKWLLFVVPAGLLVATRLAQASFEPWPQVLLVLAAWTMFALVVRLVVGRRSPWPVIAAVGGVVVVRCIVALTAVSFSGESGYWVVFWADPARRVTYIAIAFALFAWVFVAAGWALSAQLGARRAGGGVLAGIGAGLALPALAVTVVGLECTAAAGNARDVVLSEMRARLDAVADSLGAPDAAAPSLVMLGIVLAGVGGALVRPWRRRRASAS